MGGLAVLEVSCCCIPAIYLSDIQKPKKQQPLEWERVIDTFLLAHPADGEEQAWPPRADTSKTVSQPPVEKVFGDKGEDGEAHGCSQHVEDTCHVVHVQLAGHHLILLIVADSSQPLGLQLLHLAYWKQGPKKTKCRFKTAADGEKGGV